MEIRLTAEEVARIVEMAMRVRLGLWFEIKNRYDLPYETILNELDHPPVWKIEELNAEEPH